MAEAHEADDIFVYTGGDQVVPRDVRRVRIDKSVKIIPTRAFEHRYNIIDVEFHDGIERVEMWAFNCCYSLRGSIKLLGVKVIEERAFHFCLSAGRIAVPLRSDMIANNVFSDCPDLTTVDLVGGIHNTIASLHLERWRNDTKQEINRINQVLPNTTSSQKTAEIQEWMRSVISQLDHYKAEHTKILKEATTLLELALWKANLDDNEGGVNEKEGIRTTRGRRKRARKEICVTSGASIVIKNVLPFLQLG